MAALCAPTDADLINRTFAFIRTDEVKNQGARARSFIPFQFEAEALTL
jgi:hypothetical protein